MISISNYNGYINSYNKPFFKIENFSDDNFIEKNYFPINDCIFDEYISGFFSEEEYNSQEFRTYGELEALGRYLIFNKKDFLQKINLFTLNTLFSIDIIKGDIIDNDSFGTISIIHIGGSDI